MIQQQYSIYDHVTSGLINSMLYVKLLTQHVGEAKSPSAGVYKRGGSYKGFTSGEGESTYPLSKKQESKFYLQSC